MGRAIMTDDELGMAWWNSLSERERVQWSEKAGNTGRAKDAWSAFKAAQERFCQKCGRPTHSEEVWMDGQIWCHPCADE
jgi:hypothetical protein